MGYAWHSYLRGKVPQTEKTNDQFIRKVRSPWDYSRLHSIKFPRFIRKCYKRAPQLATKESKSASTKTLIVIYKLNNDAVKNYQQFWRKRKLSNESDTGWEK